MGFSVNSLENNERKIVKKLGNFSILEYIQEQSVSPKNASTYFFMNKLGLRKKQVIIEIDENHSATLQAGSMQWVAGDVQSTTGIKGPFSYIKDLIKGTLTSESAVKPGYTGNGVVVLEPTYKYIILQDASEWGPQGMAIEKGMFLACDSSVKRKIIARKTISSLLFGGEGWFNMSLRGNGVVALESNVPQNELIEVELHDDVLRIDGKNAVCWSAGLKFTVERSSKTLIGSLFNKEGLVNVYRGTGKVLLSPITSETSRFYEPANNLLKRAKNIK